MPDYSAEDLKSLPLSEVQKYAEEKKKGGWYGKQAGAGLSGALAELARRKAEEKALSEKEAFLAKVGVTGGTDVSSKEPESLAQKGEQYAWDKAQGVGKDMKDIEYGVDVELGEALASAEYGGAAAGFGGSGRVQTAQTKAQRVAAEQEVKLKFQREKETAMISNMWLDTMNKQGLLSLKQTETQATLMTQMWETLEMEAPEKMHILTKYQEEYEKCVKGGGNADQCLLTSLRKSLAFG